MQQLLYAPEVRTIDEVGVEEAPVKDSELALAKQLIGQISSKTFDPTQYEDDVAKRIEAAVQRKVEGEEIAISPTETETSGAQVIDLMEALRASLEKTTGKRGAPAKPAPAAAPAPEAKAAARKPPKKIAAEAAEPRRKAAKR
jgi:DNA end-binding protein Ku